MLRDIYPLFSRDLQLNLLFPHLLPLAVVPDEGSSLLLGLLLPGSLAEDVLIRRCLTGNIVLQKKLLRVFFVINITRSHFLLGYSHL